MIRSKGLTVYIGGEYDDYYDPDFMIYNDVICEWEDGTMKHYGYPESVFPCTDFHTATYYPPHNVIYIIGRFGYDYDHPKKDEFKPTEVFALSLETFEIHKVDVKGKSPGWIYFHKAKKLKDKIKISYSKKNGQFDRLDKKACLNLTTLEWVY